MSTDSPFIPPVKGKGLTLCNCQYCGALFRQRGTIVNHVKGGGKYCSKACQQNARRKGPAPGSMWVDPEPYEPSKEDATT